MPVSQEQVRRIFAGLEQGDADAFFRHVADDVDWTVMGTHPLAGHYTGKAPFRAATFARLAKLLQGNMRLRLEHVLVAGDAAVVELKAQATAKNGAPFDNRYCWVLRFEKDIIREVRAYLDSALVQRLIDDNEHTG